MARQIKGVLGWKQKIKLFGLIRNSYVEENSGVTAELSTHETVEMAKDYQIKAELEKARATDSLLRRTLTIQ